MNIFVFAGVCSLKCEWSTHQQLCPATAPTMPLLCDDEHCAMLMAPIAPDVPNILCLMLFKGIKEDSIGSTLLKCCNQTKKHRIQRFLDDDIKISILYFRPMDLEKLGLGLMHGWPCRGCGTFAESMKTCSGCGCTRYCSRYCQKRHWNDHQTVCKSIGMSFADAKHIFERPNGTRFGIISVYTCKILEHISPICITHWVWTCGLVNISGVTDTLRL